LLRAAQAIRPRRNHFIVRALRIATTGGDGCLLTANEMKLRGLHNVENVLAALAAGLACGAAPESMRETIKNFEPVEHRLEFVTEIGGVKFFNDSKPPASMRR